MAQVYRFTDENGQVRLFAEISPDPVPAAGSLLPVGSLAGVTLDTTTYDDPVRGGGAKLATLVFATEGVVFAVAQAGDAHPRWLMTSNATDGLYAGDGTIDPYNSGPSLEMALGGLKAANFDATLAPLVAANSSHVPLISQLSPKFTVTSGALPTVDFTGQSGTGKQVSLTRDVDIYVETGTAGSVVAALSPDNMTYTTIYTKTVALTDVCHARVPAGWYLKLTATTAVLGLGTYA